MTASPPVGPLVLDRRAALKTAHGRTAAHTTEPHQPPRRNPMTDNTTAVLARIRQMVDYWEQHLPDVIRTPAVVSAIRAALEPAELPPADRAALRQRIAEALMRWAEGNNNPKYAPMRRPETVQANAYSRADAVLAVLPAPADWAAEVEQLRTEKRELGELAARRESELIHYRKATAAPPADRATEDHRLALSLALGLGTGAPWDAIRDRAAELRRMANDAQPECSASFSGNCLRKSRYTPACDTEAGECVHGGRPAEEPR